MKSITFDYFEEIRTVRKRIKINQGIQNDTHDLPNNPYRNIYFREKKREVAIKITNNKKQVTEEGLDWIVNRLQDNTLTQPDEILDQNSIPITAKNIPENKFLPIKQYDRLQLTYR